MSKFLIRFFGFLLGFGFCLISVSNAQEIKQCLNKTMVDKPTKYRIGHSVRTVSGPPTLILHVSIKPENFNRESLTDLFQKLKKNFSKENSVEALIFDRYESAQTFSSNEHSPTYDRDMAAWRGIIFWNNSTGEAYIRFSTERNKPRDEIKIDCSILTDK